jgi:two-component system sensor kinase FixL
MNHRRDKTVCLLLLAAALLGAGWCVGQWRSRSVDTRMRDRLLRQAVHIAGSLNVQMVKELSFTPADKGTQAFEFVRGQLTALGAYCEHRGIYTMALRDGQMFFGPEDYAESDPMASPPGMEYDEPSEDDFQVFTTATAAAFGPMTDEYGTFVCALAPVCDPDTGQVLMVVGIDTLANDWNALVDAARRLPVVVSRIATILLLGVAAVRRRSRRTNEACPESQYARNPHARPDAFSRGKRQHAGLLIGMGLLAVAFLTIVLVQTWRWTREHIDTAANQQARLTVEVDRVLRDYVGEYIRPEMEERVAKGEFIPEAMSTSFVSRSVFDRVREALPGVTLRFPSTNPRNPVNRATPVEESLLRYFQKHPEAQSWSGVMEFFEDGEKHFVWAVPRRFKAGCLRCHGRPEEAPASLVERYGPIAGFGRAPGDVVMDLAAVPVSEAYAQAGVRVWRHMAGALALCVLFLGGIAFLIWTDFRRRRSAEMTIEKERHLLRLVIDSFPGFVCVKSRDGRFVIANATLAKSCGVTVHELEGKRDGDVSPNREQTDDRERTDREVFATGKTLYIPEEPITHPDGTTRWFTVSKVPLLDEGVCRQLLVVATDITERKRTEEERGESFSLLEAAMESMAEGLLVVDGRGRIKEFNRQFQELWRLPQDVLDLRDDDAALAVAVTRLRDPDAFAAHVRDLYAHREQEDHNIVEFKDGRVVEYQSRPQRMGDQIVGRVWTFHDITEKHNAEQKQAALLQKVAQANEELTHFAYVVSHDLKAPLRGIKLITEWLCADYSDRLGDDAREQLDLLQSRVARMHNLIDGILQYSRVGRIQQEKEQVDLGQLLPVLIDGIAPPEHVRVIVEPGLPVIECEKTRISQVFQNLLSNAVKYNDKPAGEIRIRCVQEGDFWQFSVSDNGPGIEPKYYERIFRLFQTLVSGDGYESTGIGLALVKKIVEMYGGRVWVESQVGQGSTFLFTLPRTRDAVSPSPEPAAPVCESATQVNE